MTLLIRLFCFFLLLGISSNPVRLTGALFADDAPEKSAAGQKSEKARLPGAGSPEEAFEVFRKAVEKDEWAAAFEIQTERSREFLVGGTLAACSLGVLANEGTKLASTFGDVAKAKELISKAMKASKSEDGKVFAELSNLVSEKPEFMRRVLAEFRKQKKEIWLKDLSKTKLVRLKIEGDRATAQMEVRMEKSVGSEPTGFLRKDGRWYLDYFDN